MRRRSHRGLSVRRREKTGTNVPHRACKLLESLCRLKADAITKRMMLRFVDSSPRPRRLSITKRRKGACDTQSFLLYDQQLALHFDWQRKGRMLAQTSASVAAASFEKDKGKWVSCARREEWVPPQRLCLP